MSRTPWYPTNNKQRHTRFILKTLSRLQQESSSFSRSPWSRTGLNSTNCYCHWWSVYYWHEKPGYGPIHRKHMTHFLVSTHHIWKISPSQLSNFEKEVTKINYDPVTPVDNIFNKSKGLFKHEDMTHCPYSQPQAILKAYKIISTAGKFRESTRSWNPLTLIHKTLIAFKTHFWKSALRNHQNWRIESGTGCLRTSQNHGRHCEQPHLQFSTSGKYVKQCPSWRLCTNRSSINRCNRKIINPAKSPRPEPRSCVIPLHQ